MSKSRETLIKQLNALQAKMEKVTPIDNGRLDGMINNFEKGSQTEQVLFALALELRCKRLHDKLYGY